MGYSESPGLRPWKPAQHERPRCIRCRLMNDQQSSRSHMIPASCVRAVDERVNLQESLIGLTQWHVELTARRRRDHRRKMKWSRTIHDLDDFPALSFAQPDEGVGFGLALILTYHSQRKPRVKTYQSTIRRHRTLLFPLAAEKACEHRRKKDKGKKKEEWKKKKKKKK